MTDFLKIAKSIVVHFAHICAYGVETVNVLHPCETAICKTHPGQTNGFIQQVGK